MAYGNIYSSMRNPYASAQSRDPDGNFDSDYSGTGYDRQRRNPGKGETPGNALEPIYNTRPLAQTPAAATPAPEAVMSGGVTGSPQSGPAGVGGNGGFGFTNLAQYVYANPMGTGSGSGYAPTPTGMTGSDYNPGVHGFTPSGAYTPGMAGVDNALNQTYGRNTGQPSPAQPSPMGSPGTAPAAAPAGSPAPAGPDDRGNRNRYPNLYRYMGY